MNRNKKIDFIKAFAIITVIIGHSIQYGSGPDYFFFGNPVFRFIYSFHMPLFMLMSGYLFYNSLIRHTFRELIVSRFTSLFIPIIMWNIVPFIMYIRHDGPYTLTTLLCTYLSTMMANSWFLWAIFYCSLAVLIVNRYFKDNIIIYIIGLLLTFIIPDSYNLFLYKFMYPYFIIGYFYHKHSDGFNPLFPAIFHKNRKFTAVFVIMFFALLYFYNNDSYIYTTGYTLIGKDIIVQLRIDIYRFIIGLCGSVTMILMLSAIYKKTSEYVINIISTIGIHSLGIYMISGLIFNYILPYLVQDLKTINYFIVILESIIILLISLLISICLKRNKFTNLLFWGGRI